MAITRYQFDPKSASGSDLFFFDWTPFVTAYPNDAIDPASVVVTVSGTGLSVSEVGLAGYIVKCRLTAGNANTTYTVSCRVKTATLQRDETVEGTVYIYR